MSISTQPSGRTAHVLSLMKQGDDAFSRQDIDAMNAVHHPAMIAHVTGSDTIYGRPAHAAAMQGMVPCVP